MAWFKHARDTDGTVIINVAAGSTRDIKLPGDPRGGSVTAAPALGGTATVHSYTGDPDATIDTDLLEEWPSGAVLAVRTHGITNMCTLLRLTATTQPAKFTVILPVKAM